VTEALRPERLSTARRTAVAAALATRLTMFLVGYLAVAVFGYPGGRPPVRDFDSELLNLPSRFDARWYLQIAASGYAYDPHAAPDVQQNIVFFPAYPMAIRALASLFGGRPIASSVAGTLLSLTAFAAALMYLRAFGRDTIGDDRADAALWLLAWYPFAVFFGAIYTESFFLLAAVGAMYHLRRDEPARGAAFGLLAGLTRPNGFLVAVPLATEAFARWRSRDAAKPVPRRDASDAAETRARTAHDDRISRKVSSLHSAVGSSIAIAAPVLGMLIYAAYLWQRTGDPWTWARGHVAWGRTYQGLTALVVDRYTMIANGGLAAYLAALPHDALNAVGALFAIATAWPVARRIGAGYAIWMLLNILPPLAAGGLISIGRFSAVLFPSFIWLASAIPLRHRAAWIGAFAALQALCAAMFYTWRPLY